MPRIHRKLYGTPGMSSQKSQIMANIDKLQM